MYMEHLYRTFSFKKYQPRERNEAIRVVSNNI